MGTWKISPGISSIDQSRDNQSRDRNSGDREGFLRVIRNEGGILVSHAARVPRPLWGWGTDDTDIKLPAGPSNTTPSAPGSAGGPPATAGPRFLSRSFPCWTEIPFSVLRSREPIPMPGWPKSYPTWGHDFDTFTDMPTRLKLHNEPAHSAMALGRAECLIESSACPSGAAPT